MKKIIIISGLIVAVGIMGCQSNQTRIGEGAAIGGLLGAAAGGIIGHQGGHGGEGAAIGAAAGILSGALIGSQMNKEKSASSTETAQNPNQLSLVQIADMAKQGVNEAVIIDKIKITGSKYTLSQADIDYLKSSGVSEAVINAMQGK